MIEIDRTTVSIYVETLFALARDAWNQDDKAVYAFVRSYLVGLVPSSALDGFENGLGASLKLDTSKPKPKPNGNGGALVTNPVPDKPLSPSGLAVKW
jgi:hypothetical protein